MRFRRRRAGAEPRSQEQHDTVALLGAEEVAFLICVEANQLFPQAMLLCASIRTFAGRYRNAPIIAVSPRPHLALSAQQAAELQSLGVTYRNLALNDTGSAYGTINRIVTGAWAEATLPHPYLIVLDTDMVMVAEPQFVRADVGVRPVDVKGSATAGPHDDLDAYWGSLCAVAGITLADLPDLHTTISDEPIRASYNGGFSIVRRDVGVLTRTRDIFFASFADDLRPLRGRDAGIKASTGMVGAEASEWWGSSQAALSTAIWSSTTDVRVYDAAYNIPLHSLAEPGQKWPLPPGGAVLVHYHYLAEPEYQQHLDPVLQRLGCSAEVRHWVDARLDRFRDNATAASSEAPAHSVCFCTMAIHAPYRQRARQLISDLPSVPWLVLTDEPADFADLGVRTVAHQPTGPMAIDYVRRLRATGNNQGAAAYHDKRFALQHSLQHHDTAIFLDADSRFAAPPWMGTFPPGISVLPLVQRSIAEHLQVAGGWRLPTFEALAVNLTGSTDVLHTARWCHEACIAITKNGREDVFFDVWGRAAAFMQEREVFSGEGGVIGLAAELAGWTVDFAAVVSVGDAVQHEGGGPKPE